MNDIKLHTIDDIYFSCAIIYDVSVMNPSLSCNKIYAPTYKLILCLY